MKIKGVSVWIWLMGVSVGSAAVWIAYPKVVLSLQEASRPIPLEVMKEDLWRAGKNYEVKGQICNTRKQPVRNVRVSYTINGKWKGKAQEVGLLVDTIKYIPSGGTVEFIAVGYAPVMAEGFLIDPLEATITELAPETQANGN